MRSTRSLRAPRLLAAVLLLAPAATSRGAAPAAAPASALADSYARPLPPGAPARPLFRPDDPIAAERDDAPSPMPAAVRVNDWYDFLLNTFGGPGDEARPRALDVNTLGEVPDSAWFTGRIGIRAPGRDELLQGPHRDEGPAPGTWTVIGAKSEGVTPGFRIEDPRGVRYLLKFDPPTNPELATGAEAIGTRIFHALGYNVPENTLVVVDPAALRINDSATVSDRFGKKVKLTSERLERLLSAVARRPDGKVRAIASRLLDGKPLGPFEFYGTRGDDANDVIPHEHRRSLRGYRVFCAWLNHDDSRAVNTLDTYLGEPGKGHVRHHLIDFGSILGSASVKQNDPRGGNEYVWQPRTTLKSFLTLGLWIRPWMRLDYPDLPSVGRFEWEHFEPGRWRPEYRNAAFEHMDAEDAFWATRLVLRFRDEDLRAIVEAASYSDPAATEYLTRALSERRDAIGRHWLARVSPLDGFELDGTLLRFRDLRAEHGLGEEPAGRTATFHALDNQTGARTLVRAADAVRSGRVELPERLMSSAEGAYFVVALAEGDGREVDVILRRAGDGFGVVGIARR